MSSVHCVEYTLSVVCFGPATMVHIRMAIALSKNRNWLISTGASIHWFGQWHANEMFSILCARARDSGFSSLVVANEKERKRNKICIIKRRTRRSGLFFPRWSYFSRVASFFLFHILFVDVWFLSYFQQIFPLFFHVTLFVFIVLFTRNFSFE